MTKMIKKDTKSQVLKEEMERRFYRNGHWSFIEKSGHTGFEFVESLLTQQKSEIIKEIKGMKIGEWKPWIKATKAHGGTKEEWRSLQRTKFYDDVLDDVIEQLKK